MDEASPLGAAVAAAIHTFWASQLEEPSVPGKEPWPRSIHYAAIMVVENYSAEELAQLVLALLKTERRVRISTYLAISEARVAGSDGDFREFPDVIKVVVAEAIANMLAADPKIVAEEDRRFKKSTEDDGDMSWADEGD